MRLRYLMHRSQAHSQNFEMQLFASSCLTVRPSTRMEQLRSQWTDFHEIGYLNIIYNSVEKIQISLISDMKNGYFA